MQHQGRAEDVRVRDGRLERAERLEVALRPRHVARPIRVQGRHRDVDARLELRVPRGRGERAREVLLGLFRVSDGRVDLGRPEVQ